MSSLPHTFPLLAGHAYPIRTARPILASLHASYIVERCHVDACCSTADVNSYKQPALGHHVQRCKCNQPWSCACLYAHDQTRPSSFLLQICLAQCLCPCVQAQCPSRDARATSTRIKWNYLKIIGLHRTTKKSHLLRDGITNESLHKFIWSQSNPTHWKKTRSEN